MPSYVSMLVHYVWSTKERREWIEPAWADDLYGYIGGVLRNHRARLLAAGGMPDHVHLLVSLPPTLTVAKAVNLMKSNSTGWVKERFEGTKNFCWQEKYGAFSVSKSAEPSVTRYIGNQAEHHRKRTFKEEFLALLQKHGIEYDERFLWD